MFSFLKKDIDMDRIQTLSEKIDNNDFFSILQTSTEVHVIPLDEYGNPTDFHVADEICFCEPYIECRPDQRRLIIHRREN